MCRGGVSGDGHQPSKRSLPQEEWWYADHVRAVIAVVMPLLVLVFPGHCGTPPALVDCVRASLAIMGLVPAVRLLFFSEVGMACKGLALVGTMLSGCLFAYGVWNLLEEM